MSKSRVILLVVGLNTVITIASAVTGYLYLRPSVVAVSASPPLAGPSAVQQDLSAYVFFPIDKIVMYWPSENRDSYVVLDLALQTDSKVSTQTLKQIEPMVRNAVIGSLLQLKLSDLRVMSLVDVQARLESDLRKSFFDKGLAAPFHSVLISKLLMQ